MASRRASEELILAGRVAVNGEVVRKMGVKVDATRDEVRVDTVVVRAPPAVPLPERRPRVQPAAGAPAPPRPAPPRPPEGAVYLLLHKPVGILTTSSDDRGRRTVMDILPRQRARVFPVGRLDEDSEGLLLLTSDGNLAQLLTHPRYEVPKTYDLRVRGEISAETVRQVERGVWLSEGRTGEGHMRIRRVGRDISHVVLTLREGKNREVRRIFARLRHPVLSLRRVALGPLELGDLRPGQCRRLSPGEVKALYAAALGAGADSPPKPETGYRTDHRAGAGSRGGAGKRRDAGRPGGSRGPGHRKVSDRRGGSEGPGRRKHDDRRGGFKGPGAGKDRGRRGGFEGPRDRGAPGERGGS
ncbi:MAG: pseudouridine synthase, partial [Planctomycetes bacterium]|nr:pseudouridine synthase [Planctomycetota bacterium]